MKKLLIHPSHYFKIFKKYIIILFGIGFLELIWGHIFLLLNHWSEFHIFYLQHFHKVNLYTMINIYSMYVILHSFYIMLACIMSFFLKSKQWFRSILYFNLFPFVGVFFGLIQIPIAIILLKKINTKEWNDFFCKYDSFASMNT